jgi:catalase
MSPGKLRRLVFVQLYSVPVFFARPTEIEVPMPNSSDDLYVHERYKFGSKEQEVTEFRNHADRVHRAQAKLAKDHSQNPQRVFHAKTQACLAGELTLDDSRPDVTRQGIFSPKGERTYNVLARFSGGVGFSQHDLTPDVRGLALKIFGADPGAAGGGGREPPPVDFLMTNGTNPFGRDQEEFVQFMEATVNPGFAKLDLLAFLKDHLEVTKLLLKTTLRIIPSLATERYWSGHPYLLGPHQAMKFNVRPLDDKPVEIDRDLQQETARHQSALDGLGGELERQVAHWVKRAEVGTSKVNANYLRMELRDRLQRGPIGFEFSVQMEKDEKTTPIENTLVEWKESDSLSIPVAKLMLHREIETPDCGNLRFTPGHYHPDHRPLGNMGRGRIFTYQASQDGRGARPDEPNERMFFGD